MATVTDCATLTPVPVHVRVNVVELVRAALVADPFASCVPLQPPDPVHAVAFCVVQVRFTVPPDATDEALLCSVTIGAAAAVIAYVPAPCDPPGWAMKLMK
jgi:hypothetical protein